MRRMLVPSRSVSDKHTAGTEWMGCVRLANACHAGLPLSRLAIDQCFALKRIYYTDKDTSKVGSRIVKQITGRDSSMLTEKQEKFLAACIEHPHL